MQSLISPLPKGWEAHIDGATGLPFFKQQGSREFSWERPGASHFRGRMAVLLQELRDDATRFLEDELGPDTWQKRGLLNPSPSVDETAKVTTARAQDEMLHAMLPPLPGALSSPRMPSDGAGMRRWHRIDICMLNIAVTSIDCLPSTSDYKKGS